MEANRLVDFQTFEALIQSETECVCGAGPGVMALEFRRRVAAQMVLAAQTRSHFTGDAEKIRREADRYKRCATHYRVYRCVKCNHHYRGLSSCNSRICERCGRRLYYRLRKRYIDDLRPFFARRRANTYGPKFLTLTFKRRYDTDCPGPEDLRRAQKEVREFIAVFYSRYGARRSRNGHYYADRSRPRHCGAVAVPEIGKNGTLHYHLLAYGPYIPKARLVQTWHEITGDSFVVDVQDAQKLADGVRYVLKYISKPPSKVLDRYALLAEWALALKGFRRLTQYGEFFGVLRTSKQKRSFRMACVYCGEDLEYIGVGRDDENILIDLSAVAELFARDGPGTGSDEPEYWHSWLNQTPDQRYELYYDLD